MSVAERIVCGVDETPESATAVRQAARLLAPTGRLLLVAAVDVGPAVHAGFEAARLTEQIEREAQEALDRAAAEASGADTRLVAGKPAAALLAEAQRENATLIAVGGRHHRRAAGILLGGVSSTLLHDAPCSVLLAREPEEPGAFPRSVVAGVDGSPESLRALEEARELAGRLDARLTAVAAGGEAVDVDAPDLRRDERKPVDALLAAAAEADLLILGSRGLHGLRALGSVSERVAHRAHSSVLVVRDPAPA